jgi:hypothetical protein
MSILLGHGKKILTAKPVQVYGVMPAELSGEPLNTVLSHMNYAIAKLRKTIETASAPKDVAHKKIRSE